MIVEKTLRNMEVFSSPEQDGYSSKAGYKRIVTLRFESHPVRSARTARRRLRIRKKLGFIFSSNGKFVVNMILSLRGSMTA